jgi:hypothetical protein
MGTASGILLALDLMQKALDSAARYRSLVAMAAAQGRDVNLDDLKALQRADDIARGDLQAEIERQMGTQLAGGGGTRA